MFRMEEWLKIPLPCSPTLLDFTGKDCVVKCCYCFNGRCHNNCKVTDTSDMLGEKKTRIKKIYNINESLSAKYHYTYIFTSFSWRVPIVLESTLILWYIFPSFLSEWMEASTQISDMDIMLAGNKNKSMLTKNVKTTRK